MALIECAECGTEVSDKAAACVKCGAPIGVVTTQQTGKKYKGLQLLGVLMICAGVVSCVDHSTNAAAGLWIAGFTLYVGARAAAWWHHG